MGRRIAIGDIHGCIRTLEELLVRKLKIDPGDELFFVGDLVDRGPDSKGVIDFLIDLRKNKYRIHIVRGNHEQMMLDAWKDPAMVGLWFNNGAEYTLKSFNIRGGYFQSHEIVRTLPEKYILFLDELPYFIELKDFIIVHAGLNFNVMDPFSDNESMIWIRDGGYNGHKARGKGIIHGHTPQVISELKYKWTRPGNKLFNIDTGCVYRHYKGYGHLTAFNLDSLETCSQENIEDF